MNPIRHSILYKYPRLLSVAFSIALAVLIFYEGTHSTLVHNLLLSLGHWGTLFVGILYVFGFTAAPASAVLLILGHEQSLLYAGIIGSIGAWIGDTILFFIVKRTLGREIQILSRHVFFKWIGKIIPRIFHNFGIYALSGIFIASPLPTEIGIVLLSSHYKISLRKFIVTVMIFHSIGIFTMLWLGSKL